MYQLIRYLHWRKGGEGEKRERKTIPNHYSNSAGFITE